jgi:hypothetical protein
MRREDPTNAGTRPSRDVHDQEARDAHNQDGKGYINQPRTNADATKQKKTKIPNRIWALRPSRINMANAVDARAANTVRTRK